MIGVAAAGLLASAIGVHSYWTYYTWWHSSGFHAGASAGSLIFGCNGNGWTQPGLQVYLSPRSWNYDWNWYRFAWQSLPAAPAAGARPSWSVRAPFWFALAAGLAPLGVAAFDG